MCVHHHAESCMEGVAALTPSIRSTLFFSTAFCSKNKW